MTGKKLKDQCNGPQRTTVREAICRRRGPYKAAQALYAVHATPLFVMPVAAMLRTADAATLGVNRSRS
jgi:hypothetical protein